MILIAKIQHDRRGVGLLELVLYIFIMTVIVLLTMNFTKDMIRGQRRASEARRLQETIRRINDLLTYDLRLARSIDSANSVFDSDTGVLAFTDSTGTTITYRRTGDALTRTSGSAQPESLTTSFVRVSAFRLQYVTYAPRALESVRFEVTLGVGGVAAPYGYEKKFITAVTLR